jgi:hypothetical protein
MLKFGYSLAHYSVLILLKKGAMSDRGEKSNAVHASLQPRIQAASAGDAPAAVLAINCIAELPQRPAGPFSSTSCLLAASAPNRGSLEPPHLSPLLVPDLYPTSIGDRV